MKLAARDVIVAWAAALDVHLDEIDEAGGTVPHNSIDLLQSAELKTWHSLRQLVTTPGKQPASGHCQMRRHDSASLALAGGGAGCAGAAWGIAARGEPAIAFWLAISAVMIIVRRLTREGWVRYRRDGRSIHKPCSPIGASFSIPKGKHGDTECGILGETGGPQSVPYTRSCSASLFHLQDTDADADVSHLQPTRCHKPSAHHSSSGVLSEIACATLGGLRSADVISFDQIR